MAEDRHSWDLPLSSLLKDDLVGESISLGLPTEGTVQELIERLRAAQEKE